MSQTNPYFTLAAAGLTSAAIVVSTLVGCRKDAPAVDPKAAETHATAPPSLAAPPSTTAPDPTARTRTTPSGDFDPSPTPPSTEPATGPDRIPTSAADPHSEVRAALADAHTHPLSRAAHRAQDVGGPRALQPNVAPARGEPVLASGGEPVLAARAEPEPEVEPEPKPEPELAPGDALEMLDGVAAHGVEKRVPQEPSTLFEEGKVWVWARIKNPGARSQIRMFWKHDGRIKSRVDLEVGTSPGWRTWSRKTMTARDAGDWVVEVRTWDGRLLDTVEFEVAPDAFAQSEHTDEN